MGRHPRQGPRRTIRQRVQLVGVDGASLGHCVIRDISATGAQLAFKTPKALPENFILLLSPDGRVRRQCAVVWRSDDALGVKFISKLPEQSVVLRPLNEIVDRGE